MTSFLNLIRALFPNWNFYDRIAYSFELEYRLKNTQIWERVSFDQKRHLFDLLINPDCNLALAQFNIIEHFARDIQHLEHMNQLEDLTTYKMLRSLLKIKLNFSDEKNQQIKFKITATDRKEKNDIFVSEWIAMSNL